VDGIWPSMDFGIWISMLSVWLDGWGEPFFCMGREYLTNYINYLKIITTNYTLINMH